MRRSSSVAQGPDSPPAKDKRVSRACVSCRMRKSKCDLDSHGTPGQPPCRRCYQEQQECVLATSRRGGRRVKRSLQIPGSAGVPQPGPLPAPPVRTEANPANAPSAQPGQGARQGQHRNDPAQRPLPASWSPPPSARSAPSPSRRLRDWDNDWQSPASESLSDGQQSTQEPANIESQIASADLLNPADALDLLAQVASHDIEEPDSEPMSRSSQPDGLPSDSRHNPSSKLYYPPVSDGYLSGADALHLVHLYREKYHPYFPIAHKDIFNGNDIMAMAQQEPHLLTAILVVASKDEASWSQAHAVCSTHMESLVAKLIYRGSNSVGAVESLLILAEWAPQRLQAKPTVGKGEEDQGSWMQVGCAVRLGYLQRLEQTGLQPMTKDKTAVHQQLARKRLVWAACYMSDRQISIRVGKGFWSRGPGPSTLLHADDFPSLMSQQAGSDNLGMLFQAHLELTQLFGNSHEILYSSSSHREHLYSGGEYVRYIDDFNATLRKWKLVWGSLSFTPHIKATLILSYDFLRLYINAFAFQATINRAISRARQTSSAGPATGSLFSDVASMPDARFIYESIDAANSMLCTLNSFIDPITGLRYMPLKYYLYVIYAAVFLFKARLAGALGSEASTSVRRAINATMDRLRNSAVTPHSPGHRYARLLYLLWRKPKEMGAPTRDNGAGGNSGFASGLEAAKIEQGSSGADSAMAASARGSDLQVGLDTLNGFSWRDLDAVGQFITNDASLSDSMLESPSFASEQTGTGMDFTTEWYDSLWSGNDVVF